MKVDNIKVEYNSASHIFSLQGTSCMNDNSTQASAKCKEELMTPSYGLLVSLDFRTILKDFKACSDSDYEEWSMSDDCQLGEHLMYSRRKRSSFCFNGKEYWHPFPANSTCACGMEDYECEFGFAYNNRDKKCYPLHTVPHCWIIDDHKYRVSKTRLREIRGDKCSVRKAKENHKVIIVPDTDGNGHSISEHTHHGGGLVGFFVFILVAGIVTLAGAFAWTRVLVDEQRAKIQDVLLSSKEKVFEIFNGRSKSDLYDAGRGGFAPLSGSEN